MANSQLAVRRQALVAMCALQRATLRLEVHNLMEPVGQAAEWRETLKMPLAIAGLLVGLFAKRGRKLAPLLTIGLSAWRIVRRLLATRRKDGQSAPS